MAASSVDTLLARFVESSDPHECEALLAELVVQHAQPGIEKIVRYKLAFQGRSETQEVEDVAADVVMELVARLRAMKDGTPDSAIGSFSGYTAVAAYHACNEYLRRKYPNRHRLKNRLRYLLNSDARFAIWENAGADWLCGLAPWHRNSQAAASSDAVSRWRDLLADLPHGPDALPPAQLLARVFDRLGGPVAFDELVQMVAWLWGVEDPPPASETKAREVASDEAHPGLRLELAQWLKELWSEIRELPQPQRVALLLNLRCDPQTPATLLLPVTGTAAIPEIAEVLGFTVEELAAIWNSLPLDDLAIAQRLGLTRQQVINLRKSARERLARRVKMKSFLMRQ